MLVSRSRTQPWLLTTLAAGLASLTLSAQSTTRLTLPNRPGSVKVIAMGDTGTGERPQYELADRMAEAHALFPFDTALMLGDNLYGTQKAEDFVLKFDRPYQALLAAGVVFHASLGNHDRPVNRTYPAWHMDGQRYYTFTKGAVRFIALDSNLMDPPQVTWLTEQLRAATEPWKLVFFHHPLYSSAGYHGSDDALRATLEPLFIQYGVNAVLSGHDHVYERLRPQHGIYYFVEGSGGQLRKNDLRWSADTAAGFDQDRAFLLLEIGDDHLDVQAIARTGRTVDHASLAKQGTGRK
jgi:predicted MPP superfamily phosphohydrolase